MSTTGKGKPGINWPGGWQGVDMNGIHVNPLPCGDPVSARAALDFSFPVQGDRLVRVRESRLPEVGPFGTR